MNDSGEDLDETAVLVGYSLLMESVQRFEWDLKRLVLQQGETLDELSFDEAWRRSAKKLRQSMGALEDQIPKDMALGLPRLRRIRNQLAHEILLRWRIETQSGMATHREVFDAFAELADEFEEFSSNIDVLARAHLRDLGIDPDGIDISKSELKKILTEDGIDHG